MAGISYNKIILVGRLTKDPELKYTPSGKQVAKFGLAVDRSYSKSDETDFFNIAVWDKLAEICGQYLKKGRLVLIEGEMQIRNYDAQDGQRKTIYEVRATNMKMLETKKTVDSGGMPVSSKSSGEINIDDVVVDEFDTSDMPF